MKLSFAVAAAIAPATAVAAPALNHVYIVLDQKTFDALSASLVVAHTLGRSDDGLPDYAPPPAATDRIFLRGKQTYLEVFAPKNRFGEPVGKVGIALGEDRRSDLEKLALRWRGWCGIGLRQDDVVWTRRSPPIPWYTSVQCDETTTGDRLALWAMTYRPEFARWQQAAGTGRAAILAPRAASGQGLFDITAVTLDLPPYLHRRVVAQLTRAGMAARKRTDRVDLIGAGWTLTLREVAGDARLVSIAFALDRTCTVAAMLGSARWSSRADRASLTFGDDQRLPVRDAGSSPCRD